MLKRYFSPKSIAGLIIVGAIFLFGIIGPFFAGDPNAIGDEGLVGPSIHHILGTTQMGQDVFSQLAWATRGSLVIGVLVGLMALVLSAFFGILGAYVGGWLDELFSLITNIMLVLPGLPLMIVIGSYATHKGVLLISSVLALTSWAGAARVLRSQTLSIRNRDYVLASRVAGERAPRIIAVEILPNLLPVMSSSFVFALVSAILGEAGLSFLGLGVVGSQTWGTMLFYAQNAQALTFGAWWWFVPPGAMIALLGMGMALINFAIDEVINPRLRTQRSVKPVVAAAAAGAPAVQPPTPGDSVADAAARNSDDALTTETARMAQEADAAGLDATNSEFAQETPTGIAASRTETDVRATTQDGKETRP